MQGRAITLAGLLTALGLVGCAPMAVIGRASIPHPQQTPVQAAGTQIAVVDYQHERLLGLSGSSLVDRAALTRVSAEDVCVQVALWSSPDQPDRAQLDEYELRLEAEGGDGAERDRARLTNVRSWVERRRRQILNVWTGYRSVQMMPVSYQVGDVCFANDALLHERSESLSLVLRRGGRERRFTWRFADDARYLAGANAGEGIHPPPDDAEAAGNGVYAQTAYGQQAQGGGLRAIPVPGGQTPGGHPVDVHGLERLIESRFELLRQCLSQEAERDPRLAQMSGRMTAEFTVGPSGVRNVRVLSNDFTEGAAACMRRHLNELPVPPDPQRWTSAFRYTVGTGMAPGENR